MIATSYDDFVREREEDRGEACWVARLSTGEVVYQDDGRPGASPPQAWHRLRAHCKETGDTVVALWLKFRDHEEHALPERAEGYSFARSVVRPLDSPHCTHFYTVGSVVDGVWTVQTWHVPELVHVGSRVREVGTDSIDSLLMN